MDNMMIFFLLRISIILITLICGYWYCKDTSKKYFLMVPILLISLNEGLRFGRGTDYNVYYFNYQDIIHGYDVRSNEFLFTKLCELNDFLNLPYQGLVYFMSLILIVSGTLYLRNHKNIIPFALPLFMIFTIDAENLMRWFTAFSFLLIGVSYLEQDNVKRFVLFSVCAFLFHSGIIVIIPAYLLLYYIRRPLLRPLYSCIIYIAIYFFFKTSFMLEFVQYMNIFSGMTQFSGYVDNADEWLTGTANFEAQKLNIGTVIMDLIVINLGYKILDYKPKLIYVYNMCLIGTILSPALNQIEILYRICLLFKVFQFIIIAYSVCFFISNRCRPMIYSVLTWFVILNLIRVHILNILMEPYTSNSYLYVWDKMGREVLFN